jgi:hypothetical protein
LLFFLLVIGKIPKPTKEDIELRSERIRWLKRQKKCLKFVFPITIWILFYTFDLFRDFRDNFSRELWDSIGYKAIYQFILVLKHYCFHCISCYRFCILF